MMDTYTGGRAIVLVEDDPDDVLLVRRALARSAGSALHLRVAGDVGHAISIFESMPQSPDLAIIDLKLPGGSGLDVIEWLRSRDDSRLVPVVVFTSSREREDMQRAYDLGANSYLVKPSRFEDLVRAMKAVYDFWLLWNEHPMTR